MKKLSTVAFGALLSLMLPGCIVVSNQPQLAITNARFISSFFNGNNANPVYYICDNKTTFAEYSFQYNDTSLLAGWSSQLRGFASGTVKGFASFTASDSRNNQSSRTVTVEYQIPAQQTPLSVGESNPQAISVVPVPNPSIIGKTYVDILVNGANGASNQRGTLGPIDVIDNCP